MAFLLQSNWNPSSIGYGSTPPWAVALSGGVDSALLASLAFEVLGQDAVSVTGISPSLSSQELDAARELSASVGIRHLEVETLELSLPGYQENAR